MEERRKGGESGESGKKGERRRETENELDRLYIFHHKSRFHRFESRTDLDLIYIFSKILQIIISRNYPIDLSKNPVSLIII